MSMKLGTRPWGVGGGVPRRGAEEKRVVAVRVPSGRRPGRMGAEEGGVLAIGGRFSPRNVGCWRAEAPSHCHRAHFLSSRRATIATGRISSAAPRADEAPSLPAAGRTPTTPPSSVAAAGGSPASPPQVARPFARCRLLPMQRMPAVVLVGYQMWQNHVGEF